MTPFILVCMFITAWCREHPIDADKGIERLRGCFLLAFYLVFPPFLMVLLIALIILFYTLGRILFIGVAIKEISVTLWAVCNFWCAVTIDRVTPDFARAIMNNLFFHKHSAFEEWKWLVNNSIKLIQRGY